MTIKWYGDRIIRKTRNAAEEAIDEIMARAVSHAKSNHPGWKSRSGRAEDSIQVLQSARTVRGRTFGTWGSAGVPYMRKLEFKHGRALIRAADATYKGLARTLRRRWQFGKAAARR